MTIVTGLTMYLLAGSGFSALVDIDIGWNDRGWHRYCLSECTHCTSRTHCTNGPAVLVAARPAPSGRLTSQRSSMSITVLQCSLVNMAPLDLCHANSTGLQCCRAPMAGGGGGGGGGEGSSLVRSYFSRTQPFSSYSIC